MWLHSGRVDRNGRISGTSASFGEVFVGVTAALVGLVWLWSSSWGWVLFVAVGAAVALPLIRAYIREQRRAIAAEQAKRESDALLAELCNPEEYLRRQRRS